jgi:hypothetical protein
MESLLTRKVLTEKSPYKLIEISGCGAAFLKNSYDPMAGNRKLTVKSIEDEDDWNEIMIIVNAYLNENTENPCGEEFLLNKEQFYIIIGSDNLSWIGKIVEMCSCRIIKNHV